MKIFEYFWGILSSKYSRGKVVHAKYLKNTYYLLFVITVGVILTILLSNKIPIEIDEHIQYWTFGCNYYNSANKNLIYYNECHHLDVALLKIFSIKTLAYLLEVIII